MRNLFILVICSAVFTTVSCERIIDVDAEIKDPKLVMNSQFVKDSTWRIYIGQSLSVIDQEQLSGKEGATVDIYENGILLENLTDVGDGYYEGTTSPSLGAEYTCKASLDKFEPIEASDELPPNTSVSFVDSARVSYLGEDYMEFTFDVDNSPNQDNYYSFSVEYFDSIINNSYKLYFIPRGQGFGTNELDSYTREAFLFDQFSTNNTTRVFLLVSYNFFLQNNSGHKINIIVKSLSQTGYRFLSSLNSYYNASGDFFSQPVQVYSNVENGIGIFMGSTIYSSSFDL